MSVEKIKTLLDQAKTLKVSHSAADKADQAAFEVEIQTAWKARFPKRKFSMKASADKVKGNQPEHGEIFARWKAKYDDRYKAFRAGLDAIEEQVKAEAHVTDIPVTDGMTLFHTVQSDSYRSQGFGMNKYAEANAQDYVDKAKAYGLKAELRKIKTYEGRDQFGWSSTYYDFEVWVGTNEMGVEILSRKPDKETMVEYVRKCDARGVNSRVFNPWLTSETVDRLRQEARVASA